MLFDELIIGWEINNTKISAQHFTSWLTFLSDNNEKIHVHNLFLLYPSLLMLYFSPLSINLMLALFLMNSVIHSILYFPMLLPLDLCIS